MEKKKAKDEEDGQLDAEVKKFKQDVRKQKSRAG